MKKKRILNIILLTVGAAAILVFLQEFKVPRNTRMWKAIADAGHFPLFGILSLVLLRLSRLILNGKYEDSLVHYFIAFLTTTILGAASEAIQIFGPREADFWDFNRDVFGALAFLGVYWLFDPVFEDARKRLGSHFRTMVMILSLLCLLIPLWSVAYVAGAYRHRNDAFPVICEFDSHWEEPFWVMHNTHLKIMSPPAGWNQNSTRVGRIEFETVTYPGFHIQEPFPDWNGYTRLTFDIYVDYDSSLSLYFRLHDIHHTKEFTDRYNDILSLQPGLNHISIPIEAIRNAPDGREMDLAAIRTFGMFAYKPDKVFSIYVDNFRLE